MSSGSEIVRVTFCATPRSLLPSAIAHSYHEIAVEGKIGRSVGGYMGGTIVGQRGDAGDRGLEKLRGEYRA
jgi:hypothetical protein